MHLKLPLVTLACALSATNVVLAQEVKAEGLSQINWGDLLGALVGNNVVKKAELSGTLKNLYNIGVAHGGNRAFGLPGFDASVDYILKSITKYDKSKSFKFWKQPFTALFAQVTVHTFSVSGAEPIVPSTLTYSPSTPAGGLEAELAVVPGSSQPCTSAELLATGVDVTDKILLIERGRCPDGTTFAGKVKTAHGAGALATIIFNSEDANISGGTLTNPNPEYIPAGLIQRAQGLALRDRILKGETLIAKYAQTQVIQNRTTTNIIAETKAGDPTNTIMLGAHLDSVQAGPGINDDGSGSALILELLRTLDAKHVKNKVRFAWWAAEENGLLGSKFYTESLAKKDADNLLAYLNFDMVGRGYYGVFDGDGSTYNITGPAGSDAIEQLFTDYFKTKKITTTPAAFTGGSDYAHFMSDLNKPVGGLHTGTGVEQDDCYHQACDVFGNVNLDQLYNNALAAQDVLRKLVAAGPRIIPKSTSTGGSAKTLLAADAPEVKWSKVEGERHCIDEL